MILAVLLKAVGVTLFIRVFSMLLGFVIVLYRSLRTMGIPRCDAGILRGHERAIPLLVILVWVYFAFPMLTGHSINVTVAAIAALGIHLGAYIAETIRAGLTSVRKTQMSAALALGMSRSQAVRTIILPQAVIRMLPSLGSLFVSGQDSAIASVIAVPELLRQTQVVAGNTYRPFELYTGAMLVYFLMCFPVARGVDMIYKRVAHLGSS